ncbi:alpha/beta hydrolase [Flavobacterium daejeonense]|uniref:alpha/beta hydrolase n=1 Tax=Flavobacterium daejeonense TaxID=350893 RepID=UPI00047923BC|nr:alpha/beta hydrolase [Flavobacterium daejeonense]
MKKHIILVLLIFSGLLVSGQGYQTKTNLNYYPDSICKTDDYIKDKCKLDVYYPENAKDATTIIWFHGGGLTNGRAEIPEALKNTNFIVVGVDYRLSPMVKAPTYIEDAAAATAWVFNHIAEYGGNPKKIFITGHSAGGYLSLMIALDKSYLLKYKIDANQIAGIIPLSGQAITHFTVRKENGIAETQAVIDKYAPLYFVRSDAPPILLITGDREMELLGRYEENAYLTRMLKLVGHRNVTLFELQGYDHNMTMPAFPLLTKFVRRISKTIK